MHTMFFLTRIGYGVRVISSRRLVGSARLGYVGTGRVDSPELRPVCSDGSRVFCPPLLLLFSLSLSVLLRGEKFSADV